MGFIDLKENDYHDYMKINVNKLANLSVFRCIDNSEDLMMKILVKDFLKVDDLWKMKQLVACGVAGLLDRYGIKAQIKWPDEVYVDDLSICKIKVDDIGEEEIRGVVVAIGLNVNSMDDGCTSMKKIKGQNYQLKQIMISLFTYFKIYYNLYQQRSFDKIVEYDNDISYFKDKKVEFKDYGLVTFTKLNDDGSVSFTDENHLEHRIFIDDIS